MLPTVRNMILNITEKTYIKILQIAVRKAEYEIQILMKCIPAGIQGVIKNILTEKNQQIFREEAAEEKKTVLRTTEEVREAALAPAEERHRKETVPRIEDEAAQAEIILLIQEEAKAVIRLETADRAAEDPAIMIRNQKIVTFLIMMMFMKNLWIHMMILKDASREKDRWTLKIWQIMMI